MKITICDLCEQTMYGPCIAGSKDMDQYKLSRRHSLRAYDGEWGSKKVLEVHPECVRKLFKAAEEKGNG